MKKRYNLLIAAAFLMLTLCFSMTGLAAYPAVSQSKPLHTYGWKTKDYRVFEDQGLMTKKDVVAYEECKVIAIRDKAAQISYNRGKETGWIALENLVYDPSYRHEISYANADILLYKRPTVRESYITVPQFSGGITVGEKGSWMQVLFMTENSYYMGWIKNTTYDQSVRLSMDTSTQLLADGIYVLSPRNALSKAVSCAPKKRTFTMASNRKTEKQKFRLHHISGNHYQITPIRASQQLTDAGGLTLSDDQSQTWKITRYGSYFYIRSKATGRALRYGAGKVSLGAFRKTSSQHWRITKVAETPSLDSCVVFSQYDPKWGGSTYYNGPSRRTISTSGCGVMALTNAIYALNGEFINPQKIASFSVARGHYFYNQGTADTLYADFARKYGKTYHFKHIGKTYSLSSVRNHLKNGRVAIALVPGHYIALVGYRSSDDSFLVLDSAVYGKRPTTIYGDWISASTLGSGTMWCEYFHILANR